MLKLARAVVAVGFLVALAVLVPTAPALAGSCGLSATCTFELTVSNVTQLSPIDVRVTWDNSGTFTAFSVQWISGGPGTPKFINEFGFNANGTTSLVAVTNGGNLADWSVTHNSQIDGFGTFGTDFQRPDGNFGITSPITFLLNTKLTTIALNNEDTEFVAHVGGYSTGCSGFVGEAGSTPGTHSDATCGTSTVPEPATLFLVGTGLAGVGFFGRKQWTKGIRTAPKLA